MADTATSRIQKADTPAQREQSAGQLTYKQYISWPEIRMLAESELYWLSIFPADLFWSDSKVYLFS